MSADTWRKREDALQEKFSSRKVEYQPCVTATVTVLTGRNVSVGFLHDFADVPDVKVHLYCTAAIGRRAFKTEVAKNQMAPVWNESFTFVLPRGKEDITIKVSVYEQDNFMVDPLLGTEEFLMKNFKIGEKNRVTLKLRNEGEVDMDILFQERNQPDFRLSLGLSEQEKQFRILRKPKIMQSLLLTLGSRLGPSNLSETPNIGLAISGGGYRAVASSCGAVEALSQSGLLDSLMYMTGLSGSSWYISSAYLHKSLKTQQSIKNHHDWLRKQVESSLTDYLFDLSFYGRYKQYRNFKIKNHQKTTFVDFYGLAIGETFLGRDHVKSSLSSMNSLLQSADAPYPILSCAHVHENFPMSLYWDEVEITPHEVSIPTYGINIPEDKFNSRWGHGILEQKLPPPYLHYMMGTSGSAFAILWSRLSNFNEIETKLLEFADQSPTKQTSETEQESSDSEDDIDSNPRNKEQSRNFASSEDKWIEELEKETSNPTEKVSLIGRSFLIERTAKVTNFARNMDYLQKYLFKGERVEEKPSETTYTNQKDRFQRKVSTSKKNVLLCDSALGCNLPTIHVLRPQRSLDILIIVDCGNYSKEDHLNMDQFVTVQNQLYQHGIKFPRMSIEKILEDPFREFYLFEDEDDPECPIVLWFTLSNKEFRKQENVVEYDHYENEDGKKFNDFSIYPETSEFGVLKLSMTPRNFDRVRALTRFNVLSNINIVKDKIAQKVKQLRMHPQ